ncbi:hypothetical protein BH11CYA1_BH11CYA1_26910 [soil metagenome]
MVRVNNLVEADAQDNTAVKGSENKSKSAEKFGNIAVDSWKDMENDFKGAKLKGNLKNSESNHNNTDKFSLTFDDPFKSNTLQEKKMMSNDDLVIQKKKEAALDDANVIQKKKELAESGKPGAKVEGELEFSPDKPKVPADGGLKDFENGGKKVLEGGTKDLENTGKKVLEGGTKDLESKNKAQQDGGLKNQAVDPDYYLQKL